MLRKILPFLLILALLLVGCTPVPSAPSTTVVIEEPEVTPTPQPTMQPASDFTYSTFDSPVSGSYPSPIYVLKLSSYDELQAYRAQAEQVRKRNEDRLPQVPDILKPDILKEYNRFRDLLAQYDESTFENGDFALLSIYYRDGTQSGSCSLKGLTITDKLIEAKLTRTVPAEVVDSEGSWLFFIELDKGQYTGQVCQAEVEVHERKMES